MYRSDSLSVFPPCLSSTTHTPVLILHSVVLFHLQDVNIGLFEHHIRGGLPMASLGAGGRREVAALPPSLHAHAATAAVSCVVFVGSKC